MSSRIADHLRRNVYGLIAIFIALGGTAYAANTVGSADIIDNSVASVDLRNNHVRSADVLDDALTANDIAQNTLGFRETATSASDEIGAGSIDEFDVANNSLTGADINESTLAGVDDTCPNLMTRFGGVICLDDDSRGLATWGAAVNACADAELRLPTPTEAYLALQRGHFPTDVAAIWTDAVSDRGGTINVDRAVVLSSVNGEMLGSALNFPADFYCAVAPSDLY